MITIDCNYPGGNIIVESIDEVSDPVQVNLRQDQRSTAERWFYWNFRVCGATGKKLVFNFTDWEVIGTRGAAVSTDGRRSWQYLPENKIDDLSFFYEFPAGCDEAFFAFCTPYQQSDLELFASSRPAIKRSVLCQSGKGRDVELLAAGSDGAQTKILLTARHHACEAVANFVLEGLIDTLLAEIAAGGSIAFLAVPFADKDGVEDGDQGKNRNGHDHNRDYIPTPRYNETAAIMALGKNFRPQIAIDLHCPWIRGKWNEEIYIVGTADRDNFAQQQALAANIELEVKKLAAQSQKQLPRFTTANILPFGQAWNTNSPDPKVQCSFSNYFASWNWCRCATTIETAYANVGQLQLRPENIRLFGKALGKAVISGL